MNQIKKSLIFSKLHRRICIRELSSNSEESFLKSARKCLVNCEKNGYIMKSPYERLKMPEMTVDRHIWNNISKWPNHVAIECSSTGRKYTYAKLRDCSAALAIRLRVNLKLEKNDIAAICLPNVPEYPILFLGSIEGGLKVTTVNSAYTPNEIAHQLADCQVKVVFCEFDNYDSVKKACDLAKLNGTKIILLKTESGQSIPSGAINFDELVDTTGLSLADSSKFNDDAQLDNVVILPYSSGTTGLAKGVMHSHKTFTANAEQVSAKMFTKTLTLPTTAEYQDIVPSFLPFYHIFGMAVVLQNKLSLGCKIISMRKYEINHFLDVLTKHKATMLSIVPPVAVQLGYHEAVKASHFDGIRSILSGASHLSQEDTERLLKKAPRAVILQGYGMTEGFISISPQEIANYQSVGLPFTNGEVKIAHVDDPNFKGVAPNETGEILFRGPNVMRGYFNNIKATKETLTEDGWIRTGDTGYYDENGFLYVVERLKELIKVNAFQVAPAELESILRDHPDLLEAVVVGIPNVKCGEVPKAFVVRKASSKITEIEIQNYVAKQVSKHKHLTGGVQFVDSIPKSAAGKILRREIKRLYL